VLPATRYSVTIRRSLLHLDRKNAGITYVTALNPPRLTLSLIDSQLHGPTAAVLTQQNIANTWQSPLTVTQIDDLGVRVRHSSARPRGAAQGAASLGVLLCTLGSARRSCPSTKTASIVAQTAIAAARITMTAFSNLPWSQD
jgi:hypothetical protein